MTVNGTEIKVNTAVLMIERRKEESVNNWIKFPNPTYSGVEIPFHFVKDKANEASAGKI